MADEFSEDPEATLPPGAEVPPTEPGATIQAPSAPAASPLHSIPPLRSITLEAPRPVPVEGQQPDYYIEREIGRGGMGVVYAASQTSLARTVAVKMTLPSDSAKATMEQRFISEALITAELDHPNIIPVYDLARDASGRLLVGMKMVQGTSWEQLLHPERSGAGGPFRPMTLASHLEVLQKVCDAVGFAHSRGIVHRDLKPANVMVGEFGEVLVMDWGIALDVSEGPRPVPKTEHRSAASGLGGTPAYMAPEQALGEIERVAPTTDIYQLGGILYEILTGTPPHRGDRLSDVLERARSGWIEPADSRASSREIPQELAEIALKALAFQPEARFPQVRAFQAAIRDYIGHQESISLATDARRTLDRLEKPDEVPRETRYGLYSSALSRLAEALHLWPDNETALKSQARAAASLAGEALDRGDPGLAAAQLPLIALNRFADPTASGAIEAALAAHQSRLKRGLAAVLVVLFLLVACYRVFTPVFDAEEERRSNLERQRNFRKQMSQAYEAICRDDVDAAQVICRTLEGASYRTLPQHTAITRTLRLALVASLAARRNWSDLLALTLDDAGLARPVPATLLARWGRAPGIAGSFLSGRLGLTDAAEPSRQRDLWLGLKEAASAGTAAGAIEELMGQLEAIEPEPDPILQELACFRRSALWALAELAALKRSQAALAQDFASRIHSATLRPNPLDAKGGSSAPVSGPVQLVLHGAGLWRGLDPKTGGTLWESPVLVNANPLPYWLMCDDGSAVLAGDGQLINLDASTGRIRARLFTGGAVRALWTDPRHAHRLEALVSVDETGSLMRRVFLESGSVRGAIYDPVSPSIRQAQDRSATYIEEHVASRANVSERLRSALERDPQNHVLMVRILQRNDRNLAAAELRALAERAASVPGLTPLQLVTLGVFLERSGYTDLADALYRRAGARFEALGGNPDLVQNAQQSPGVPLRLLGGELFARGRVRRALDLIEISRQFATYLDGDDILYRRYLAWMRHNPAPAPGARSPLDATQVERRVVETELEGRWLFIVSSTLLFHSDLVLLFFLIAPFVLMAIIVKLWTRARQSARADLLSRGIRTRVQRVQSFFTQPVDRMKYVFLGYASRTERLILCVLGLAYLAASVSIALSMCVIRDSATMPQEALSGYPAADGFRFFIESRLQSGNAIPQARRVNTEALHQLGMHDAARKMLEQNVASGIVDPLTLNNLGCLDEEQGRLQSARTWYARAAALAGEAQGTGAWNLRRLSGGSQTVSPPLPHQDQVRASAAGTGGNSKRPLWAQVPGGDLVDLALAHRSSFRLLKESIWATFNGQLMEAAAEITGEKTHPAAVLLEVVTQVVNYLVLGIVLLAAIWLPFPVRPLLSSRVVSPVDSGVVDARRAVGLRRAALVVYALLFPGIWDLAAGRSALGSLKLVALLMTVAVRLTSTGLGLLTRLRLPSFDDGYFLDAVAIPHSALAQAMTVSAAALIILYAVEIPLVIWRASRGGATA